MNECETKSGCFTCEAVELLHEAQAERFKRIIRYVIAGWGASLVFLSVALAHVMGVF